MSIGGNIRDNLIPSPSGKILLLASWTTNSGRRKFNMYPEFCGGDDTEGTNVEQRPLYTFCGKDHKNQVFPWMWAFLPSKSLWVYIFLVQSVPILHPGTGVQRVVKINTDADQQETRAIADAVGLTRKNYYTNAVVVCESKK